MSANDRSFRDRFSLIIGVLVGVAVGLFFLAASLASRELPDRQFEPAHQRVVAERVAPFFRVAVAGRDNSALKIQPDAGSAQPETAAAMPTNGTEVYDQVCTACHAQGIAGAPKAGDKAAWAPRIAQGKDTLYRHAIEGFQGKTGVMPPKGGRADLPDDLVRAAVDHLLESST